MAGDRRRGDGRREAQDAGAGEPRGHGAEVPRPLAETPGGAVPAVRLIRQRRSAVAMDGATSLPATGFFALVDRLVPRPGIPPWDALPWAPRVHPVLFVHRVDGLAPGLYVLERSPDAHAPLREALRPSFAWERPEGGPEGLRLFRLEEGDTRSFARLASCQQEIASDSAFAVAMLAEVGPALDAGAWWYRRLHWEAGLLGQVLYLEAEARACARRASAASSTTSSTTRWASRTAASATSTTSRSAARSRTGGSSRDPATTRRVRRRA